MGRNLKKMVFWVAKRRLTCSKRPAPRATAGPISLGREKRHAAAATVPLGCRAGAEDDVQQVPLKQIFDVLGNTVKLPKRTVAAAACVFSLQRTAKRAPKQISPEREKTHAAAATVRLGHRIRTEYWTLGHLDIGHLDTWTLGHLNT